METPFLRYTKEIDADVVRALEGELRIHVIEAKKTQGGEFNYSYKITSNGDPLIARVFRQRNEPPDGKLAKWITPPMCDIGNRAVLSLIYSSYG